MMRSLHPVAALILLIVYAPLVQSSFAQSSTDHAATRVAIAGDALLSEGAYRLLETISDRFGPRMVGTRGHAEAMDWLESEVQTLGLETRREAFTFPGWERGADTVTLLVPEERPLRAVALGYTAPQAPVEAEVVYLSREDMRDLDLTRYVGKVMLLAPSLSFSGEDQAYLAQAGVRALLMINRVGGGQVLARVANRSGRPTPLPLFSITQEEGFWLQRRLEIGEAVRVRVETTSRTTEMTGANLVATIPGTSGQKIVIGAHFDSWDLGQGALDNGLGVAQVYEVARLLSQHSPQNPHTVELAWFDAEEFGLWGARRYVERHTLDDVRLMLNLDMVGEPQGFNAMGFDELVPVLTQIQDNLGVWRFSRALTNKPWLGSDHHPFIMAGVPSITFYAPINEEASRYYHDFGDTFDKVKRPMLTQAAAVVALTAYDLAQDTTSALRRYSPAETAALFQEAGLEQQLRAMGQWPFGTE